MDWQMAIDRHGTALRRIVSTLVAMVGRGTGAALRAPDATAAERPTLARRRHRALMRVLRPAEAAARRLVIAMALTICAPQDGVADDAAAAAATPSAPPRPRRAHRPRQPAVVPAVLPAGSKRTGIVIRHLPSAHPTFGLAVGSLAVPAAPGLPAWAMPPAPEPPRRLRLPLTDPVRRKQRRRSSRRSRPGIWFPGSHAERLPAWRPPQPDDRLDATRLVLRIEALADAMDDLTGEAKRFLRWRARRAAERARDRRAEALAPDPDGRAPGESPAAHARRMARRFRRVRPLRLGLAPGGRVRRNDELLALRDELQWLAFEALARHDTS